ncbi:MAG: hypothetical protein JKY65_24490 [Planctomycetes bacterium]|nr:hypothetical protein [Planctomycetota bacterium]
MVRDWDGLRQRSRDSGPRLRAAPAAARRLDRDEVLSEAASREPDDAIAFLDRYPFDFDLEQELEWFRTQEMASEVLDYLSKRARIDWESLRGDVDPDRSRGDR